MATAAGVFKSVVSLIMVLAANKIAKMCGESGFLLKEEVNMSKVREGSKIKEKSWRSGRTGFDIHIRGRARWSRFCLSFMYWPVPCYGEELTERAFSLFHRVFAECL